MNCTFQPLTEADRHTVIDLFNYYVKNSFAAYPEKPMPYAMFDYFLTLSKSYPVLTMKTFSGDMLGFGLLRPYQPMETFSHTAEIAYFLHPDQTGKGYGKALLDLLEDEARKRHITTLLATISSLNPESLRFHCKHGFVECGRLSDVGKKKGCYFGTVWMQKKLPPPA